jgi:hypothetical protein
VRDKLSFGFEDMGEQIIKNIARPVGVHRTSLVESATPIVVNPPQLPPKLNCRLPIDPRSPYCHSPT